MYNKRKIGAEHEQLAAEFLRKNGYTIIDMNYYCRLGEIDIIAKEQDYFVFIEVKYRSNLQMGYPEEAVHVRKQRSIIRTARFYMLTHGISEDTPCRFDVVVMLGEEIKLISDAFTL